MLNSVDYSHGDLFVTFLTGALNYQVAHHIFPCISQYYYPEITPLIIEVCEKYGLKY